MPPQTRRISITRFFGSTVAYSRFVAQSLQAMMPSHGRGYPHPLRTEITKVAKAARMDPDPDGGETRLGQKLSGGRGAWEEEHLHRQLGSDCEGVRGFAFEALG